MKIVSLVIGGLLFLGLSTSIAQNPWIDKQKDVQDPDASYSPLSRFVKELLILPENERELHAANFVSAFPHTPVIESDTVVGVYYYGYAKGVYINGDFQDGWSSPDALHKIPCGSLNFFYITYKLPGDARLDYQLIVDSVYMTDPRNDRITPSGYGPHSEIAMPGFIPDPARARFPEVPRGSIDTLVFTSKDSTIVSREMRVYLPANYRELGPMSVLYVMDGIEALGWMDYPNILDNLIYWKRIEPVVVVFIPPVDRGGEFMGAIRFNFLDAICDEIVPMMDLRYPTKTRADARGITGISAGGYFALLAVMSRGDVIGCGAGQSPAITTEIYEALHKLVKKDDYYKDLKIYLDMGRYDLPEGVLGETSFIQKAEELNRTMEILKVNHMFNTPNDGHEWANWRERTSEILEYFFK